MIKIRWGFIGCGEVTEHKSGPAFNNVEGSSIVAAAIGTMSIAASTNIP